MGDDASNHYDLEERTAVFGEECIEYARSIKPDDVTGPLVRQFVRSSTSIGANYCEADEAGTKKEFRYRISVSKREAKETKFWIRMLAKGASESREEGRRLWKEANELMLIFAATYRRSDEGE